MNTQYEVKLSLLNSEANTVLNQISLLESKLSAMQAELGNMRARLDYNPDEVMKRQYIELQRTFRTTHSQLQQLNTRLYNIQVQMQHLQGKIEAGNMREANRQAVKQAKAIQRQEVAMQRQAARMQARQEKAQMRMMRGMAKQTGMW